MSLLDDLINIRFLLIDGVKATRRKGLNLIGVAAVDNEDEDRTDITLIVSTTTSAPFTQPAVGATVDVSVTSSSTLVAGQIVLVKDGGYYAISSVLGATSVRLQLLAAIASVGATVATGKKVVSSGTPSAILLVASTVYVDATNGTASGARGDAAKPFDTIANGLAAMQSGDTLCVRPGTYSVSSAITLPNLAVIHIVLEPGVLITSSDTATFTRTSTSALTTFTLDGGGGTIANTNASGTVISLDGSSVPTTPGYATGTGKIEIRNVRLSPNATDQDGLSFTCLGNVFLEDIRCSGKATFAECGLLVERNLDQYHAAASVLTVGFNTGATLPDGFAGPGTFRGYSLKTGAVALTGSLNASFDASCEFGGSFGDTRSAGLLDVGYAHFSDNLALDTTGTATNEIAGVVDGNVTTDNDLNFAGLIRGNLTATAGTATVRGSIVGTATESGGTINRTMTFESLDGRVTAVEGGGAGPAKYTATGTYSGSATSPAAVVGCTVTPAAGTYAVIVGAIGTNSGDAANTIYLDIEKDATGVSGIGGQAIGVWSHPTNCVVTVNGSETVNVKTWCSNGNAFAVTQCEMLLLRVAA